MSQPLARAEAQLAPAEPRSAVIIPYARVKPARVRRQPNRRAFSSRTSFRRGCSLVAKRFFDIGAASCALALLALPMVLVWCLVVVTSRGPGVFWSRRVGYAGRLFFMPKFRTLRSGVDVKPREALTIADAEFTPFGRFLRRTGLDELPQLISVLQGDMSLIGPRPLLPEDPAARARLQFPEALMVRPGISGLAQVQGRNEVSPRRKARLDALYARAVSLRVDCSLAWRTVLVLASGAGFR